MITYILKAILFSALLFLIYALFLEKEKMHQFKRFYLILGIILSFTVPLITINTLLPLPKSLNSLIQAVNKLPVIELTGLFLPNTGSDRSTSYDKRMAGDLVVTNHVFHESAKTKYIPNINDTVYYTQPIDNHKESLNTGSTYIDSTPTTTIQIAGSSEDIIHSQSDLSANNQKTVGNLLLLVYLAVTSVLLLRFTMNLMTFRKKIKQNRSIPYHGARLVLTKENLTPYSFLKYIFVNEEEYKNCTIDKAILGHELIHTRQKHSADIIFIELLMTFAWVNPLLPLFRKAIQLNHEFLADEHVVKTFCDTITYQLLLIDKVRLENRLALSSPFNFLLTKKRIIMMGKAESPKTTLAKQIVMIPVIAFAVLFFMNSSVSGEVKEAGEPVAGSMDQTAVTESHMSDNHVPETFYPLAVQQDSDTIRIPIQAPPPRFADDMVPVPPTRDNLKSALPSLYLVYVDGWIVDNGVLEYYEEIDFAHHSFGKLNERSLYYGKYDSMAVFYTLSYYNKHRRLIFEQSIPPGTGVQQEILGEYKRIINKYTPETMTAGEQNRNIRENISQEDKSRLEKIYSQMTLEQRKDQRVIFLAPPVVSRNIPTREQFKSYSDPEIYGVWLDGKRVENNILANYTNTDFAHTSVSRLNRNATNYGKHVFQVNLMSNNYFEKFRDSMSSRKENLLMFKTGGSAENRE